MSVRLLPVLLAAGLAACAPSRWQSDYRQPIPPGAVVFMPGEQPTSSLAIDGAPVGDVTFAALDQGVYAYQFAPAAGQQFAQPVFVQVTCGEGLVLAEPIPAGTAAQGQIARCAESPVVAKALYKPS
jgi:hypothetical protein